MGSVIQGECSNGLRPESSCHEKGLVIVWAEKTNFMRHLLTFELKIDNIERLTSQG